MTSLTALLSEWPLIRQIRERTDGTGLEAMSDKTRAMHARIDDAEVARSICPYCGVGCGQLIYHKGGKLVSIGRLSGRRRERRSQGQNQREEEGCAHGQLPDPGRYLSVEGTTVSSTRRPAGRKASAAARMSDPDRAR